MICKFCNKECLIVSLETNEYVCKNHKNTVFFEKNGRMLIVTISSDKYESTAFYIDDKPNIFYLDDNSGDCNEIMKTYSDPKLTPENFEERIRTLLVFS